MICKCCADRCHQDCPGGSWCDCQHVGSVIPVEAMSKDDRHALMLLPAGHTSGPVITVRTNTNGAKP